MVQELLPLYDNCKEGVYLFIFKHEQNSSRKVGTLMNCKLQKPHMLFTIEHRKHRVYKRSLV